MHKVIDISLTGHPRAFRLHDDAYEMLRQYLEQAGARLGDDPDRAEVIGDLERSIGERLDALGGSGERVIDAGEVRGVLDAVGAVDAVRDEPTSTPIAPRTGRRRLYRIREGQAVAGVCTGLAAYADLNLDLVRWTFALLATFTAGLFILVYIVMMFVLPVVATRADWIAAQARPD